MAQESYIGTPPPPRRSEEGRIPMPYAVGFTDSLYTSSQRREQSSHGEDRQYDFTNVFGTSSTRGRPTEETEERDTARRPNRRRRENSQVRTTSQGSPTRTPGEGSGGTTIQERILAKLSELEAQGKATSVTMAGISSRLDHVESYVVGLVVPEIKVLQIKVPQLKLLAWRHQPLQCPKVPMVQVKQVVVVVRHLHGLAHQFVKSNSKVFQHKAPQNQMDDGSGKGIDVKWIPQVPDCKWSTWKNRRDEIQGFWSWAESLSSWLGLLQPAYPPELKEVLSRGDELKVEMLSPPQISRSSRVFYLLKQAFSGNKRVEAMVRI